MTLDDEAEDQEHYVVMEYTDDGLRQKASGAFERDANIMRQQGYRITQMSVVHESTEEECEDRNCTLVIVAVYELMD